MERHEGVKGIKKYFLIATGILAIGLAVAGIFLPLLPTTPFVLLAAACFFRSSQPLYAWLVNHRLFGKRIRYFRVYKAISLKTKVGSLFLLWMTIGFSVLAVAEDWWLKIILLLIAVAVSLHLLSFRTLDQGMIEAMNGERSLIENQELDGESGKPRPPVEKAVP